MSRIIQMPEVTWDWVPWFAWRPVKKIDRKWTWLCRIEKRKVWFVFMYYEYREIPASVVA